MSTHGLGTHHERESFERRVAGLGAFGLRDRRGPFPADPRGLSRDELLRRRYARRQATTRAEFVRRLAESFDRAPLPSTAHVGLYQLPEPRHFAGGYPRQPQNIEAAARAFLSSPRPGTRVRFVDAPAPRNAEAARRTTLAIAAAFLETHPTAEQLIEFAEGYNSQVRL